MRAVWVDVANQFQAPVYGFERKNAGHVLDHVDELECLGLHRHLARFDA